DAAVRKAPATTSARTSLRSIRFSQTASTERPRRRALLDRAEMDVAQVVVVERRVAHRFDLLARERTALRRRCAERIAQLVEQRSLRAARRDRDGRLRQ